MVFYFIDLTNIMTSINKIIDVKINNILNKSLNEELNEDKNIIKNIVFSGGSSKGVAQLGALHYLYENGLLNNVKKVSGTSVGAMNALLFCIGYKPKNIYKMLKILDMKKAMKPDIYKFVDKLGMEDGNRMMIIIRRLLRTKKLSEDITFIDLYKITGYDLIITGSCVSNKKIYYFNKDSYPKMKVIESIRISISIPIFFIPHKFKHKLFVDGGCIDNYPIHIFNDELENTIGIYVSTERKKSKINSIESYMANLMDLFFEGNSYLCKRGFEKYTIEIKCENIPMTDPNLDDKDMIKLFDDGYISAMEHIKKRNLLS